MGELASPLTGPEQYGTGSGMGKELGLDTARVSSVDDFQHSGRQKKTRPPLGGWPLGILSRSNEFMNNTKYTLFFKSCRGSQNREGADMGRLGGKHD